MSTVVEHTADEQGTRRRQAQSGYIKGFLWALGLTIVPFTMVALHAPRVWTIAVIVLFGVVQLGVHVRFFLHVDLSPEKRDDRHLLMFSTALLILMVLGSLWVLFNMASRMML